jgi:tetratricopeptide (TPR) repeat protein
VDGARVARRPRWRGRLVLAREALGRVGQYDRSISTLTQFVQGGPHPLLESGRARLGWWSLAAERYPESIAAFRSYITSPRGNGPERPWVEAGLAVALFPSDPDAARGMLRGLEGKRSPLVVPLQIRLTRAMIEAKKPAEVPPLTQELLGATLTNAIRAHVLLLKGEGYRLAGNRDEARTQYELAQRADRAARRAGTRRIAWPSRTSSCANTRRPRAISRRSCRRRPRPTRVSPRSSCGARPPTTPATT